MISIGHFSVPARQREKQKSRERDERLIDSDQVSAQEIGRRNGLFSALDPSIYHNTRRMHYNKAFAELSIAAYNTAVREPVPIKQKPAYKTQPDSFKELCTSIMKNS